MSRQCTHYGRLASNTILRHLKTQAAVGVNSRIQPGSDVIVCAKMDEQWGYVGAKSRQRWLFYAYDRIRRGRLWRTYQNAPGHRWSVFRACCRPLRSWYDDGWLWPLYESRLKGKLHVISKRYTQRIEWHNLNLRQHLARLDDLSFSKSVELHDKVIGHYLNIKHYQ
ncbi:IS1 family transposase [Klebsiella quasipneumoniae]|uniref:IS1 family transposase n=1 Tax=Klebsiella quasipneumoniae TaxID=1463165 RepID=UPI00388CEE67